MQPIAFYKMSGSGNDFIVIDNRDHAVERIGIDPVDVVRRICRRKMSVGADGVILVENTEDADFEWRFYNSDGSLADMCGNGARCVARFARLKGIAGPEMTFVTGAGIIHAMVLDDQVKIKMSPPKGIQIDVTIDLDAGPVTLSRVDTGVPHAVVEVGDIDAADVVGTGRAIRHHPVFSPAGTNANFISREHSGTAAVRTYERGVEDETLACGTGAVAGALVLAQKFHLASPLRMRTRSGGHLTVHFDRDGTRGPFENVYLEGDARIIYAGNLGEDAWRAD